MPNAHNGYYDTMLETGHASFAFLLLFIRRPSMPSGASQTATRPVRTPAVVCSFRDSYNFLESLWMRGFEFLWVAFVIVAAEIRRYACPFR